ncbi:hypothetical protein BLOT_007533 [Blomia tropicalis]|nr:hypothetical protein BLOT_007533 [Blomia tropicalis]
MSLRWDEIEGVLDRPTDLISHPPEDSGKIRFSDVVLPHGPTNFQEHGRKFWKLIVVDVEFIVDDEWKTRFREGEAKSAPFAIEICCKRIFGNRFLVIFTGRLLTRSEHASCGFLPAWQMTRPDEIVRHRWDEIEGVLDRPTDLISHPPEDPDKIRFGDGKRS